MKYKLQHVFIGALTTLLCSCAATSVKHTWKSPAYLGGPPKKMAVVAADPRDMVRQVFEGQFSSQLEKQGVAAFPTRNLMSVDEMKANREAAAARFRELGADTVLIVRLVDSATRMNSGTGPQGGSGVTFGADSNGWFDFYWVIYNPSPTVRSDLKRDLYLDTSVYDLKTGRRLWSGLTETTVAESADRLELVRPLVTTVLDAMRKDGFIP